MSIALLQILQKLQFCWWLKYESRWTDGDGLMQCRQTLSDSVWYLAYIYLWNLHFYVDYRNNRGLHVPFMLERLTAKFVTIVRRSPLEHNVAQSIRLNFTFQWFELHTWENSLCFKTTFFSRPFPVCVSVELCGFYSSSFIVIFC